MARGELLHEMKKLKMTTKEYFQAKYAQRLKSIAEQVKVNTVWRNILDFRPSAKKGSGKNNKEVGAKPQMLMYDGSFVGLIGFKRIRDKLNNSDLGPVVRRSHLYERSDVLDKVLDLSMLRGASTILKPLACEKIDDQSFQGSKPSLMLLGVDKDNHNAPKDQSKMLGLVPHSGRAKPGDTLLRASQESYLNMVRRGSFNPQILETIEEKVIPPVQPGPYRKSTLVIGVSRNEIQASSRLSITSPNQSGPLKPIALEKVPSEVSNRVLSPPQSRRSILMKLERGDVSKSVHDSVRTINKDSSVDSSRAIEPTRGELKIVMKPAEPAEGNLQSKKPSASSPPKSKRLIEKFLGNLAQGHEKFVFKMSDRLAVSLVLAYFAVSKEGRFVSSSRTTDPKPSNSTPTSQSFTTQQASQSKSGASQGTKDSSRSKQPANKFSKFSKGTNK